MFGALKVGTAGWGVPPQYQAEFPTGGSHLERYAHRLPVVEINTSFYRPHRVATYERWSQAVPADFRFAVKMPKEITHTRKLVDIAEPLDRFLAEVQGLGEKLGPLLVQFPPSFAFNGSLVSSFFERLRGSFSGQVACEPRHATWFDAEAETVLVQFEIARVAADPAKVPAAAEPGGWPGLVYYRLHGSPEIYYSAYGPAYVETLSRDLQAHAKLGCDVWCIFDNTARGEAANDALDLLQRTSTGDSELSKPSC
jgi:uncharacterized protein YecE (DUF72 family)